MAYQPLWRRLGAFWLAAFLTAPALMGGQPQFWEQANQEELIKGRLNGVSLTSDGKIVPAPRYQAVFDAEQAYLFALATDRLGNIYAGSGHDGKVFKLDKDRKGSLFYKTKELDVFALAVDSANYLYIGSSPDGKVYKVAPDGIGQEFFDPKEKYIWAMTFDRAGNLYVATGGRGVIYKVSKKGEGEKFLESDETHIISMTFDLSDNLIAGSSPSGYVYQVMPDGKTFVLYDSSMNEIRSLVVDRTGNILGVALSESSGSAIEAATPVRGGMAPGTKSGKGPHGDELGDLHTTPSLSLPKSEITSLSSQLAADTTGVKSLLFQIAKDGTVTRLRTSKEDIVYSLLARDDGYILAGTGTKGRILSISPARRVTILVESSEEQVTAMIGEGGALFIATSNLGKIFQLKAERSTEGSYESEVMDTRFVSSWGAVSWRVQNPTGQAIEIRTRTGNTRKPNKHWSAWSDPYKVSEGDAIKSPRARYIQWQAVFKSGGSARLVSEDNALERLSIAYLPANMPPRVTSISIMASGVALQKIPTINLGVSGSAGIAYGGPSPGSLTGLVAGSGRLRFKAPPQQRPQPGARSITWKAEDDNDDELQYQAYFRAEGSDIWKLLEKDLTDEFYTMDSTTMPDGVYYVKIVASDVQSNAYGKALTGEMVSKPFIIDNTPPAIELGTHTVTGKRAEIYFIARDATSKILSAEFSVDGSEWRNVYPKDEIADSKVEAYQLIIDNLSPGEHTIAIKAIDAMGNAGAGKALVKVK
ncbi:MAG: hypothetical protein HYR55_19265 [Acidobacteria bacterium]|nr:hypothetical protein [Acidobacteriota bacterium]MBI3655378.1 hypothetical protein [Acidobacteriota bacterium]